jgi:CRISPR-associated protein Cas1
VLADDLLEPFRPWVDEIVHQISSSDPELELNQGKKRKLLQLLEKKVARGNEKLPLMTAISRISSDLKIALTENKKTLDWFHLI